MAGWSSRGDEDPLAYGHYNPGNQADDDETYEGGDRGLIGDAFRRLRAKKQSYQGQQPYSGAVGHTYIAVHRSESLGLISLYVRLSLDSRTSPSAKLINQATTATVFGHSFLAQPKGRMEVQRLRTA